MTFNFQDKFGIADLLPKNTSTNKPKTLDDIRNEVALDSPFGEQSLFYTGIRTFRGSIPKSK